MSPELFPELAVQQPPYPADTQAKGWRFELDYEQIEQSDTCALADALAMEDGKPLGRALLLAMWYAAWKATPCGSLPAEDRLLAAAVRIPLSLLNEYRAVLLRGWWQATDGRVYHPTLTARVVEMLEYRRKNAKRVADFKAKQRDERSGNALPAKQSRSKNGTGTGTSSSSKKKEKRAAAAPRPSVGPSALIEAGFDEATAAEFIAHKAGKKAPLTERAWKDHLREAKSAGWTALAAAEKVMAKDWQGFEAKYVAGDAAPAVRRAGPEPVQANAAPGVAETQQLLAAQAARKPTAPPPEIAAAMKSLASPQRKATA